MILRRVSGLTFVPNRKRMKKLLLITFLGFFSVVPSTIVLAQNAGLANPVITEIMYNPPEAGNDTLEFLEIYNPNLGSSFDLSGAFFSSGIEYTFPVGYTLAPDSYVILSGDSVIFEAAYGMPSFEWTGGTALSNDGEGLTLRSESGSVLDTVYYDDTNAWADADQTGYSLVLCDPYADNNLPSSWTLSENPTGIVVNSMEIYADPGAASTCTPTGISEQESDGLAAFPNPSNGNFRIQMAASNEATTIRIFNTMGQVMYSTVVASGTTSAELDTDLKAGHYIFSIEQGNEMNRMKLVIQ